MKDRIAVNIAKGIEISPNAAVTGRFENIDRQRGGDDVLLPKCLSRKIVYELMPRKAKAVL